MTRYTGGAKRRLLNGSGKNWLHGHWHGNAGVAYYQGWKTRVVKVNPDTDWVVLCGTNAASNLKLVNGIDAGTATGGSGGVSLQVNQGEYGHETSHFAIAEVVVWDRGLTSTEMHAASDYFMLKTGPEPQLDSLLESSLAWYKEGMFDLAQNTWPDTSGNNDATLSGSGLTELRKSGHGAVDEVVALQGTTSSRIDFGPIIKAEFTICSMTRYTGGAKRRLLNGSGKNWLHGHWHGNAGVAYYQGWKTRVVKVNPDTDWVVLCGTNAASNLKLVNGIDAGTATGGSGGVSLQVNQGEYGHETSHFAIAEVVVWDRGLTSTEMHAASDYFMLKTGPEPQLDSLLESSLAWYKEGMFDLAQNTWPDTSGNNDATLSGS